MGDTSTRRWPHVLAGGIAGSVEIATTWPFEYAKTQLQLPKRRYHSIFGCITDTIHKRGFRGLYGGLPPLMAGEFPKIGVRYATFTHLKQRDLCHNDLIRGLIAGSVEATLVTTPVEALKTRYVHEQKRLFQASSFPGWKDIYKGLGPTVTRSATNCASRFYIFHAYAEQVEDTPLQTFLGGVLAGTGSVLLTTPVDVVKTRSQALHATENVRDTAIRIFRESGIRGFYYGTLARLLRVAPGQGIIFSIYRYFTGPPESNQGDS